MCTVTAMDNVRKAYDKYYYSSDCFDFRRDARLEKMIFLVKGNDELSSKIASEIRAKQSFYSTYTIDEDLCAEPTAEQINKFASKIQELNLQGSGMLIAHKLYYSKLIEDHPSIIEKMALIRPDYDNDYIQLMVDFTIGRHYASRVRVLKEKNAAKVGVSNYYKNIMPFDVMILPSIENLRCLVCAAYIYQEIKLRHNIIPKVYVQCSEDVTSEKELALKLLTGLCVENISFIDKGDIQALSEIVFKRRVLFITPQRRSLKQHHDVEEMRKEVRFSPSFYVVKESFDEVWNQPEYLDCAETWHSHVLKDIYGSLDVVEQTEEVIALKKSLTEKLDENTLRQSRVAYAGAKLKVDELVERHQAYLKHLFKI